MLLDPAIGATDGAAGKKNSDHPEKVIVTQRIVQDLETRLIACMETLQGFNAADSANIADQNGTGDLSGSIEGGRAGWRGAATGAHHVSNGSYGFNSAFRSSLAGGAGTWSAATGSSVRATIRHADVTAHFPTDFTDNAPALAQSAIGQFDVRATPLQMAMVAAAVANRGVLMSPYLVQEVRAPDLSVLDKK